MRNICFLFVVFVFAACGGRGKAPVESMGQGQVVSLSDSLLEHRRADTIAFGRLRSGEIVSREFAVLNAGAKALVITRVDLSCGCVQADYPQQPLMPGGQAPMTLALDTRELSGRVFKTVGVQTSLSSQSYTLCVTAEIIE